MPRLYVDQSEAHACSSAAPIQSAAYGLSAADAGCFPRDGGGLNTVLVKGVGEVTSTLRDSIDGDGGVFGVSLSILSAPPLEGAIDFKRATSALARSEFAILAVRNGWVAEGVEIPANAGSFSLSAEGDSLLSVGSLPSGLGLS